MNVTLRELRTTLVGFGAALVVLLALFSLVGIDRTLAALGMARWPVVVLIVVVALSWLTAWSASLRTVLGVLGIPLSLRKSFLLFASATFANNTTPFGQAGGEPFSALLISRTTDSEYETGLAAIASVDALNFVPSILLALVGVGYYATTFTLGRRVEFAVAAVVALALVIPLALYAGWHSRDVLRSVVVRVLTPLARSLSRVVPRYRPPTAENIERRIDGFFGSIERVARNRRGLALALSASALGWLLLSTSLWLSLYALGHTVPPAVVLFIIPVGSMAGVTPLPGGLGGVETALVLMVVPTTGVDPATASAAVVVHRSATYLLPVLLGGGAVAALEAENAR